MGTHALYLGFPTIAIHGTNKTMVLVAVSVADASECFLKILRKCLQWCLWELK